MSYLLCNKVLLSCSIGLCKSKIIERLEKTNLSHVHVKRVCGKRHQFLLKFYKFKFLSTGFTINASVTFALRQVYDAPTMSKSPFPYGLRRKTLQSSYGFTGIVASTILVNSAQ